ncbi:M23 family metallopeptidase [Clostridium sporogenes]|uniref:M23 family metallopeptidase n=2 Tax=Clostridium TaxID=1485 RepID=A0A6M0T3G8_CLOBO|nr:M23 family metallopeptidase [Clostridium sporogenes]NFA61954.1 M23 family metallopeptidase [Clostridium botulinum]MDS1004867.1 M23 family metallopeptidase [Clostridium sporogenes]NFI75115.1 M23 family metallopeptidase [Clostridium sporogenes]NFL72051.1 M23 family metallopeptidase [Clostridium sporogenes]NFM25083.1 M23 family metallopeptidase [Clostridium sporogenes]
MSKHIWERLILLLSIGVTIVVGVYTYICIKPNAYEVSVNDNPVAYVENKEDFNKIYKEVENNTKKRFNLDMKDNIDFKNIKVKGDIFTSNNSIKKSILENSNAKVTALKVKFQDEFLGILLNKKEIQDLNKIINKKYSVNVIEHIKIKEDIVPVAEINTIDELAINISKSKKLENIINSKKLSRGGINEGIVLAMPTNGCITSKFGRRWGKFHKGLDIGAPSGNAIYCSLDGRVIYSGWEEGYGKVIKINHNSELTTIYAHCSSLNVKVGQYVKKGEKIAEVGSTGRSTGPHVHFELRKNNEPCNPLIYIR